MNIKKPNRKKRSYVQQLDARPEEVFPLLCPVREVDWVPGWLPEQVISGSGVCEHDCIFITPPEDPSEPASAVWVVTKHDSENFRLEMYKVTPGHTVSKLEIALESRSNARTAAHVSYELTAIGDRGERFMENFTEAWYEDFMLEWERQLNHYLDTGQKIS